MIRIILADNLLIFRVGAAKILALQDDIRIVAQCADSERLSNSIRTLRSSVAIFASSLQPKIEALIPSARVSGSKLILLAENTEFLYMYADHGLDGVLFRDVAPVDLVDCVKRVAAGENYLQQRPGGSLLEEADAVGARVLDKLTPKEIQIVALITEGYKNKEIATCLSTTEQVIKNYLKNIFDKTGVSDRLGLALFTIRHRILAEAATRAGALIGI